MFLTLLQVAAGGAIGAAARFLTGQGFLRLGLSGFPWATLAINVVGSFLMGLLVVLLSQSGQIKTAPFLLTGLLGGFTTFSAFSLETVQLIERGAFAPAAFYAAASVGLSLAALVLGLALARSLS